MILNQQIKEGLFFQHKSIESNLTTSSCLIRHKDHISLTCIFSGHDWNLNFNGEIPSQEITFIFHDKFLEKYSSNEKDFSLQQINEHQQNYICCNTQMILHDLINCTLAGAFRNMFIEVKALELLLCFQKCNSETPVSCDSCRFLTKPTEKDKILKAREILVGNLDNPPTISELSREVGINQCYLKKGFKEIFNSTVYDFVQEQRMMKAKFLLSTTNYTVSEVAEQVGFSSQSNFSSAFKKFTGILPKEFSKN